MYTLAPPPSRTRRWLRRRCKSTTITPQVANAFATVSAVKSNFISALLFDLDCISFNIFVVTESFQATLPAYSSDNITDVKPKKHTENNYKGSKH
ncbi:hypothetical protein P8452_50811 [Trifolium repens]|nr:hypothetical protein P8452_50811 [Trifolium repens]